MKRRTRWAVALACAILATQDTSAFAQWDFPVGMGMWGWGGWGVGTVEGDLAQGLGVFAMGAGIYNKQTAIAHAIDTETMIRWNEYVHEAQATANRQRQQRMAQDRERNTRLSDAIQKRLRENPEPRDIFQGSALNAALDDISDPRVYVKALQAAKVKVGGDAIRSIPFTYAAAAITVSIDQLVRGHLPASLRTPEFQAEREAIAELDRQIKEQVADDKDPDPATLKKLMSAIYATEEKVAQTYPRNSRERNEADRYLRALHGLAAMLKTPAIDLILAGVEKRPDATLGELLNFMRSFNLRFGVAATPRQRDVYTELFPKLAKLRSEVAPALAAAGAPHTSETAPEDFFSGMTYDDLQKKAPKP
jgi:hypothetical protein